MKKHQSIILLSFTFKATTKYSFFNDFKIKLLFPYIFLIFIISCSNPVDQANKVINEQFDTIMQEDIKFINTTMVFIYYSTPSNYWYPEEYTYSEIIDDKYKIGYEGLEKLKKDANQIETNDENILNSISKLNSEIEDAQKDIKKKQAAIKKLENSFVSLLFGGISGLNDFDNSLSTKEQIAKKEKERTQMPPNVKSELENLINLLTDKYKFEIINSINELEKRAIGSNKLEKAQLEQIRATLKLKLKERIILTYQSNDTICRDKMLEKIFDYYDNQDLNNVLNNITMEDEAGILKDVRDNKEYKTVKIGNQIWMAENLAYKPDKGTFFAYSNDLKNVAEFGYLYDLETAKNACPAGWHLPTEHEWNLLEISIGITDTTAQWWHGQDEGGKLKEKGNSHWEKPNEKATNEYGFTALPGGYYSGQGEDEQTFQTKGYLAFFWSSTKDGATHAWCRKLSYENGMVIRFNMSTNDCLSVRCLKNENK